MIQISKIDDLNFTVRFDPQVAADLYLYAGWGTAEDAVRRILSEALLPHNPNCDCDFDLDDDVPF